LSFFALYFVVALIVRIIERDGNRFARWHASEALNLQLTFLLVWNLVLGPPVVWSVVAESLIGEVADDPARAEHRHVLHVEEIRRTDIRMIPRNHPGRRGSSLLLLCLLPEYGSRRLGETRRSTCPGALFRAQPTEGVKEGPPFPPRRRAGAQAVTRMRWVA